MLAAKIPTLTFLSLLLTCPFEEGSLPQPGTTGIAGNTDTATPDNIPGCTDHDCSGPSPQAAIVQASATQLSTCALDNQGQVYCWGNNTFGQLGLGHTTNLGAKTPANTAGPVPLGKRATMLASGRSHSCALLEDSSVICWGDSLSGQLGQGYANHIGNNETPNQLQSIRIGKKIRSIHAGEERSCAISIDNTLHCWGSNNYGVLGYGHTNRIGDDESPISAGAVNAGGDVKDVALSQLGTCALLLDGSVRCWGLKDSVTGWDNNPDKTQLAIGDDEVAAMGRIINLPGPAIQIEAGGRHMCARVKDKSLHCWGEDHRGQVGRFRAGRKVSKKESSDGTEDWLSSKAAFLDLALSGKRSCAIRDDGTVHCWGEGKWTKKPASAGLPTPILDSSVPRRIRLPGPAKTITSGFDHSCAVLDQGLYCWGQADFGQLGYGNKRYIGQDEDMEDFGPVPLLGGQGPGVEMQPDAYDGEVDYKLSFRWPYGAPPEILAPGQHLQFKGTHNRWEEAYNSGKISVDKKLVMLWFSSNGSPRQTPARHNLNAWGIDAQQWAEPFALEATKHAQCPPLELEDFAQEDQLEEQTRHLIVGQRMALRVKGGGDFNGGLFPEGSSGTLKGGYYVDVHSFREWKGLEHLVYPTSDFGFHESRQDYNIIRRDCGKRCEAELPDHACRDEIKSQSAIYGRFSGPKHANDDGLDPAFDLDCRVLRVVPPNSEAQAYAIWLDCIGMSKRTRFPHQAL